MASEPKTALITGGTKGIGRDTARKLAQMGYRVSLTGRRQSECDEVAGALRDVVPGAQVEGLALDVSSFDAVRAFARAWHEREQPLHLLINNAAVMTSEKEIHFTPDGLEATMATNVLGPFLLTRLLLDVLLRSAPARIVNVGSRWHLPGSGHGGEVSFDFDNLKGEKSYDPIVFYKNSKLATMWFTYEIERRLGGRGVTVNAVCPGFVPATLAEHATGVSQFLFKHVLPHMPRAHTVDEASENTVFAATDPKYAARGGVFIGERQEVASSEESHDEAKAQRFWDLACRLTGVDEQLPSAAERSRSSS